MHQLCRPLLSLGLLTPAIFAHPLTGFLADRAASQYGYWDLTLTRGSAASGYRWENLAATYSGAPEAVVNCKMLYDPTVNETTRSCDESSFSYEVDSEWPENCKSFRVGTGGAKLSHVGKDPSGRPSSTGGVELITAGIV
jgi:hypothetical protein